jgi:hypothetical protein
MGSIRHFAGKPPKVRGHTCDPIFLRNRTKRCSISLVLTGIGGATRFAGDAIFQLLPLMAPFIGLDLGDGPMNHAVALHQRIAVFIELTRSRRN